MHAPPRFSQIHIFIYKYKGDAKADVNDESNSIFRPKMINQN